MSDPVLPTPTPVSVPPSSPTVEVTPKPYWASRTILYNYAKGALSLVTALALALEMLLHQGTVPFYVNEGYLLFAISVLLGLDSYFGVQLRKVTIAPIAEAMAQVLGKPTN